MKRTLICIGPRIRAGKTFPFFLTIIVILLMAGNAGSETDSSVMAPLAPKSLLLDAVSKDGQIFAVGERGHVLISSDKGMNWRQVQVPTRETLTGVFFLDNRLGWAVGHDAVILRTRDGGEHWEKVYEAPEDDRPLFDVWFRDDRLGFAIGAYGLCLRTLDGGDRWEPVLVSEEEWHLYDMTRSANGHLYIAAESGQIYRSDDNGDSWVTLSSPYDGSFFGVMALEGNTVLIFGLRGHVFRSDDAGASWQRLVTDTAATLADGAKLADGRILLAGLAGTVLVGKAQDTRFETIPGPGRLGIWAVIETVEPGLICFGERGATRLALKK
jgi:photosystem II stability/assembly factor-like uncharacterized protein